MRNVVLVVVSLFLFTACAAASTPSPADQRKTAVHARAEVFDRAQKAIPAPRTQNFPLRRTLAEMTARQDLLHHPWYVYILGENGNAIGYYVAKTVPINACDYLDSTEDIWTDSSGDSSQRMTAPSRDGIYYGGGGASSTCDAWVFLDVATNALIQIRGVNFFSSDQPLRLDAKPIKVAG